MCVSVFRLSETNLSSDLLKKNIWTNFFDVQMTVHRDKFL